MRPLGEISRALRCAAAQPGTVVQLAHRAQVGVQVARYTASRMVDRGVLVVLEAGRPAVLAVPDVADGCGSSAAGGLAPGVLPRSFWEGGAGP